MAPMMKSDSANGTRSGLPPPKPRPISPPQAMPNRDSTIWPLPGLWSKYFIGSSQMLTRFWTWAKNW